MMKGVSNVVSELPPSPEYNYGDGDLEWVRKFTGEEPSEEAFSKLFGWFTEWESGTNLRDPRFHPKGGRELHHYVKERTEGWPLDCVKLPRRWRYLLCMDEPLGCLEWVKAMDVEAEDDLGAIFEKMPFLEYLTIYLWGEKAEKDVEVLEKFPLLRSLKVSFSDFLKGETIDRLGGLTGLERLSLEGIRRTKGDFIRDLSSLERLSLKETAFRDVSLLGENLKRLSLNGCHSLFNIEGIERCQGLEWLDLGDTSRLKSLEPVAELKQLTRLHLEGKTDLKVSDLSFLGEMEALEEVVLRDCPELAESREAIEQSYPHIAFYFDAGFYKWEHPRIDVGLGE